MTEHAVVVGGGGPTRLMLAGELALAGVDVAIVERRASQELAGSRACGLHSRTIEVLDQRGIADRFLSQGQVAQVGGFSWIPTRADRVRLVDAKYTGPWELPVLEAIPAPTAVLIRPDGYVAWVGDLTHLGLPDALTTWFGPPTAV
jgi:2-polyprenyl-6-methoxyphenol hydroxylase-like FAD-dependent oxidoreductase